MIQRNKIIRAPHGGSLTCKGWIQEAAMRMLMNNLDPEVAENPSELIVYGGRGKAVRDWNSYNAIIKCLKVLKNDESLLIQSGKPVGILKSHKNAPRVIIANSNLVGHWANWEHFNELEKNGLIMFGQMTAGSWIYIGTQGILQGTYETFTQAAKIHFNNNGSLTGKIVLTAGLGGMGGAQPLAVTMCGGVCFCVEIDIERINRRLKTNYLDVFAKDLDEAILLSKRAKAEKKPLSIGLLGNAALIFPKLLKLGFSPDMVTDQTSAHDPMYGYVPKNIPIKDVKAFRSKNSKEYLFKVRESMVCQVEAMLSWFDQGIPVFDYGNNLRSEAKLGGCEKAFNYPGFVAAYIRPLFCEGMGPFRWVALSGDENDIKITDDAIRKLFPYKTSLIRWLILAQKKVVFQGLPSRICWLGYGERHLAGLTFNRLVKEGKVKAPIVIGRDHLDCGSVASPNRETENMLDGSDAIADWPILNALINAVNGASWISFHQGGGVGMGYSLHAGQVLVADGSDDADNRIKRVLESDPAMGILRHVDAGYSKAINCAKIHKLKIPMKME